MKKIDKLILRSFIGPFVLTFFVVVFILLTRHMLMYFDDIIGKGLGWEVLGKLLFYFSIFMIPTAMPLAVLLSSLITFGNLGEHFELTAIKSAGISLLRVLRPIFIFILLLTGVAFYANNNLVPEAALEAYSLIFDIKQKKPAMDLREGVFYSDIPGISIKVNKKFPEDESALKDVMLYDHKSEEGNTEVIAADSGRMASILDGRYLKFELFNGYRYTAGITEEHNPTDKNDSTLDAMTQSSFSKTEVVYDLSSFELLRTDKRLFENDRLMRNLHELDGDIDSINKLIRRHRYYLSRSVFFNFSINDSAKAVQTVTAALFVSPALDSIFNSKPPIGIVQSATNMVRQVKSQLQNNNTYAAENENQKVVFEIQWHRIWANSLACIAMFLIGAPLGAIIRRGGLGVPFLISIAFFIVYYLLGIQTGKLALHQILTAAVGIWIPNCILLLLGIGFLRQAQRDSRLFESDFYSIVIDRVKRQVVRKKPEI